MSFKRLIYFGTPDSAVPPLRALVKAGHEIPLVITGKDKPKGRGQKKSPTPVKTAAEELGLTVSHNPADALALEADLGVVVAYGSLIKEDLLNLRTHINMHFSLLPRWRGAAPVERAILAGDQKTGVCLMELEPTLDTGSIYSMQEVSIEPADTTQNLKDKLIKSGTALLLELLASDLPEPVPQEGEPVWAEKIQPQDLELDLKLSVEDLHRRIRVGGAWLNKNGKRLKILEAHPVISPDTKVAVGDFYEIETGVAMAVLDGALKLVTIQQEGKKILPAKDWYQGWKNL